MFITAYKKIDPVFREKLLITVSMTNNCAGWVSVHSAVGRKAGITKDGYLSLIKLDKKDFEYREWVALTYAREWAFAKGGIVPEKYFEEFKKYYSTIERKLILKLIRTMLFANYCGNAYYKRPWKKESPVMSCEVDFEKADTIVNNKA